MNHVSLIGFLGQDPVLRHTKEGVAVCNFSIATNRKSGNVEIADWHNIVVWDKAAEPVAKALKKGSRCAVIGRLQYKEYLDKKDGSKRYQTEIVAVPFGVEFLDGKPKSHQPEGYDFAEFQNPVAPSGKVDYTDDTPPPAVVPTLEDIPF